MNGTKISIALALAGIAGAQTPAPVSAPASTEDATARAEAKAAATKASQAFAAADEAKKEAAAQTEQIQAVDGKVDGLNEAFLDTKATVDGLKKLKISGLIQAQAMFYSDTNILSSNSNPYRNGQQAQFLVRRGRLKAAYDAGNGSQWVMQYDIKQSGVTPQDIYVKWSEPWLKTFSLQAGLQDIPFGYEIGYSSSTMEWLERSRFERNAMFKDEKDVGFILGIAPKVPGLDDFSIKLAALSGYGITDDVNDPKCFVGRLNLAKNFADEGVGLAAGVSYYMDSREALSTIKFKDASKNTKDSVFQGQYYVVDGSGTPVHNDFHHKLDANLLGADAQITWDDSYLPGLAGLKLMGELYTGKAIGTSGGNTRSILTSDVLYVRKTLGWYVSLVQNIDKLAQVVVRYDVYDPNTDVSGDDIGKVAGTSKADLAYDSWYFGVNWFLNGNTKLAIGYDLVNNEKTASIKNASVAASNFTGDVDDNILTARIQFAF